MCIAAIKPRRSSIDHELNFVSIARIFRNRVSSVKLSLIGFFFFGRVANVGRGNLVERKILEREIFALDFDFEFLKFFFFFFVESRI